MYLDPPSPPQNVHIEDLTKENCTLSWQPPSFDGGSPIKGYIIEKSSGYSSRWIKVNRDPISGTSKRFTDLVEENEYNFRVLAVNEAGTSKPSDDTGVFVAKDPFDKPGKPGTPNVDEITAEQATLTWTAPIKDGGAKITAYIVEVKEKGDSRWRSLTKSCAELTYVATGLREETTYEFRVTAQNKAGAGPPSDPSSPAKYTESIIFTRDLQDQKVKEVGVEVTLECEISKEGLKLEWYKGTKKITRDLRYSYTVSGKVHKLTLDKVSSEDVGEYIAEYQNLSTSAKLTVEGMPQSFYFTLLSYL